MFIKTRLAYLFISIWLGNAHSILLGPPQQNELSKFASALSSLRTDHHGCFSEIKMNRIFSDPPLEGRSTPASISTWTGDEGKFLRQKTTQKREFPGRTMTIIRWDYQSSGFSFFITTRTSDPAQGTDQKTYVAELNEGRIRNVLSPIQCSRGLDRLSGYYWDEILTHPNSQSTVKADNRGGYSVNSKLENVGEFSFYFDSELKLVSMNCKKGKGDLPNNSDLTFHSYTVDEIDYSTLLGKSYVSHYDETWTSNMKTPRGLSRHRIKNQFQVTQFSKTGESLGKKVSLPDEPISNGTEVRVKNDKGIPYVYRDGLIFRMVLESAIVTPENARFRERKNDSARLWYFVLASLLLTSAAVLYRAKRDG